MSVRFKPEVRMRRLPAPIALILELACEWSLVNRIDVEVNSMNDGPGVHMENSLHYADLAIDLDTVGDKQADTLSLALWMQKQLPAGYDVLFENTHVHVEWDTHRAPLTKMV